jgi:hypothetical protein
MSHVQFARRLVEESDFRHGLTSPGAYVLTGQYGFRDRITRDPKSFMLLGGPSTYLS